MVSDIRGWAYLIPAILQGAAAALVTSWISLESAVAGLVAYGVAVFIAIMYLDKTASTRSAIAFLVLSYLSTALGSLAGLLYSRSPYSGLLALGISLSAFIYTLVALRIRVFLS